MGSGGFIVQNQIFDAKWTIISTDAVKVTATQLDVGVLIEVTDATGTTSGIVYNGKSAQTYMHSQLQAASVWEIEHNLDKKPAVTVVDSGDNVVIGDITYDSTNKLTITFKAPFAGKAYLN